MQKVILHDNVALLEFADDFALDELLASTDLSRYLVLKLSPRAAIVDHERIDDLVESMIRKGHTPKVTGQAGQ